jgi:hypothetical protein
MSNDGISSGCHVLFIPPTPALLVKLLATLNLIHRGAGLRNLVRAAQTAEARPRGGAVKRFRVFAGKTGFVREFVRSEFNHDSPFRVIFPLDERAGRHGAFVAADGQSAAMHYSTILPSNCKPRLSHSPSLSTDAIVGKHPAHRQAPGAREVDYRDTL